MTNQQIINAITVLLEQANSGYHMSATDKILATDAVQILQHKIERL